MVEEIRETAYEILQLKGRKAKTIAKSQENAIPIEEQPVVQQ